METASDDGFEEHLSIESIKQIFDSVRIKSLDAPPALQEEYCQLLTVVIGFEANAHDFLTDEAIKALQEAKTAVREFEDTYSIHRDPPDKT